jgi:hypothetical protein
MLAGHLQHLCRPRTNCAALQWKNRAMSEGICNFPHLGRILNAPTPVARCER